MPTLKNLSCQIRWADTNAPFQEYGTFYGDGVVETYLAVPEKPQAFNIRLTSKGFIYEGLAVAVFIDGTYQCNRNRVNLLPAKKGIPREGTEIEFVMRQKEKAIGDGTYMGRQWRFDDHNIVPDAPKKSEKNHFVQLGLIEVIVMRCRAKDSDDTNASTVSSAAESRILDNVIGGGEGSLQGEDDQSGGQQDEATEESAPADDGGSLMGGMFGLFDGAADYPPYHNPSTSGYWPGQPPAHPSYDHQRWQYDDYAQQHGSNPYGDPYSTPMPYRPSIPPRGSQSKRVHFDYGPSHHTPPPPPPPPPPPKWDSRYSDGLNGQQHPRPPGYAPGLSDWAERHPSYQGPPAPPHSPMFPGPPSYGRRSQGYPTPPPAPYAKQAPQINPPHYGPIHHSPYLAKFPPQAAPPFPPFALYGQQQQPGFYGPGWNVPPPQSTAPQDYQGAPFVGQRQSSATGLSPKSHPQGQVLGSLDPAKEENNPGDAWNQSGGGDSNNNNGNGSGNDNWGNSGNTTDNSNNNWENPDNTNNNGDWGNNGDDNQQNNDDNNNADDWGGDQNNNDNQPSGSADTSWDANDNSGNPASGAANDGWGPEPSGGISAPNVTSPGARALYGPHGAYYAAQSVAATDVPCDAEEEPRYDVPESVAKDYNSRKQVQPGKGYLYTKRRCAPVYVDSLKEPYARFVFQYRTKDALKQDLKLELDVEPSGSEEVQKYQDTSKDELIQMLLRAKGALGGRIPSPPPKTNNADSKSTDPFEPVAIEPPDISHLDFDLPPSRSELGGEADKGKSDDWNTTPAATSAPGAWPDTPAADSGGQKQDEWGNGGANNDTGGATAWGDSNQSTQPDKSWDTSNNADSSQKIPKADGEGKNGNPRDGWNNAGASWGDNENGNDSKNWDNNNDTTPAAANDWSNNNNAAGGWGPNHNAGGQATSPNGHNNAGNWDGANITPSQPATNQGANPGNNQQSPNGTAPPSQQPATVRGGWTQNSQGGWYWPWNGFAASQPQVFHGYGQPAAYYGPPHGFPRQQYPSTQPATGNMHGQPQWPQQTSPANNVGPPPQQGNYQANHQPQPQTQQQSPTNAQNRGSAPNNGYQRQPSQNGPPGNNLNQQNQSQQTNSSNNQPHQQRQNSGQQQGARPNNQQRSGQQKPQNSGLNNGGQSQTEAKKAEGWMVRC